MAVEQPTTSAGRQDHSRRDPESTIPRWLERGLHGQCHSSITEHILGCDCDRSDLLANFSILVHARNELLLKILEALSIRQKRPNLCRQKELVIDLCLHW